MATTDLDDAHGQAQRPPAGAAVLGRVTLLRASLPTAKELLPPLPRVSAPRQHANARRRSNGLEARNETSWFADANGKMQPVVEEHPRLAEGAAFRGAFDVRGDDIGRPTAEPVLPRSLVPAGLHLAQRMP